MNPVLAISLGCPAGIGPEVALAAAASVTEARPLLVGDRELIVRTAPTVGLDPDRLTAVDDPNDLPDGQVGMWAPSRPLQGAIVPGHPSLDAGRAQLAWVDEAIDLVAAGAAAAIVTGPVSKEVIARGKGKAAKRFRGHTEHIARRVGGVPVMAFDHPTSATRARPLTIALVTTHVALRDVPDLVTAEAVAHAVVQLAQLLPKVHRTRSRFSLVVAALNPHAGEGGLLGHEEIAAVAPGIDQAREVLAQRRVPVDVVGPQGAETAFRHARDGAHDGVLAMYHDQATIVSKLLGFGEAVNVTLGLPIVRTSVDHGTAYELAGTGKASSTGMTAALALARRLSR